MGTMKKNIKQFVKKELNNIVKNKNYYGSNNQIKNEIFILNETSIKMKDKESIEEYYLRIQKTLSI